MMMQTSPLYSIKKWQRYVLGVVFIVLLYGQAANGQAVNGPDTDLNFDHFNSESGLAHSNTFAVLQDSKGFIWIGTERGLTRFDGRSYKSYVNDPTNPNSLYDHFVLRLAEGRDGVIWIGSREGLARFDPETEAFRNYVVDDEKPDALQGYLNDLLVDQQGRVWVAMGKGGLGLLNQETGTFQYFNTPKENDGGGIETRAREDITHASVLSLTEDRNGKVWAGLEGGGINRLSPDSGVIEQLSPGEESGLGLPESSVHALHTDSTGTVWVGTEEGLSKYNALEGRFEHLFLEEELGKPAEVISITDGFDNSLWIGTWESGMLHVDTRVGSIRQYTHQIDKARSVSHNQIRHILQDKTGSLWTTTNSGLSKADLRRKPFLGITHSSAKITTISHKDVYAITEDKDGDLWVGTLSGLNQFDQIAGSYIRYFHDPNMPGSIAGDEIWSVFTDHEGNIWLGVYGEGINKLPRGEALFTQYANQEDDSTSFQGEIAFIFYEDSQHRLWIGSELGLNLYDPVKDAFLFYTPFSDNEDWGVRAIQEDEHGLIWIGTEGKGLFSFDTEKASFKSYPISSVDAKAGVASTNVLVLFRDSEDILWIGTDKGLNALIRDETGAPTGRFDLYLTQDGLADNGVVGMLEDELGRLWISTSNGLSRATKTAHLEEEEVYGLTFRNYDHRDGLQSNVFYIGPTFKDADGLFYFGGDNGFTVFNPLEIKDNLSAPAVIITDVQLFNKSITAGQTNEDGQVYMEVSAPYAKALNLSHEDRVVSVSFAGLHFSSPEKNQYKYRLEGFEDDWNEVGDLRQATYTNLPAGDYVFTVIASNLDGVWNEEGASISISVSPPFWETGWFRSLAGFIILSLLIAVYQIRTRSIRERNILLEKRVAVRTEELRVKNALLESTNDALQLSNTELKESNDNLELKSQELRESVEKNKEILGITAHDLKNPLGGIIGMSDVLLQDAGEMEAHAYVSDSIINIKMLKNEAVQMLQNIRDLLDRYREDQVEEFKTEKADLKVAVETVLRWNHKAAREKNISIVCDEVEEVLAEVDVIAIQRVMDNLVSNAVKYSHPGDSVYVTLTQKARDVRFAVRDTGQGLTSEDKGKVFGKLQRLSAKPTAGEHSTGLGLYIAKKLIESHDGAVGVDSEFGEGATFWFEVPVPEPVVGIERVLHGRPD